MGVGEGNGRGTGTGKVNEREIATLSHLLLPFFVL